MFFPVIFFYLLNLLLLEFEIYSNQILFQKSSLAEVKA